MINKAIHTFALLSVEDAGELASSGVFWQSVPTGDSARQVGETESMSGVRLFWYITRRKKKKKKRKKSKITHTHTHESWLMTNMTVAFRWGRAARVFSPGIVYLVTGRLECKPLLLCSARILWMNQDCTIRGGGGQTDSHIGIFWSKRPSCWHLSTIICTPWAISDTLSLLVCFYLRQLGTARWPDPPSPPSLSPIHKNGYRPLINAIWDEKRESIYKYAYVTISWAIKT